MADDFKEEISIAKKMEMEISLNPPRSWADAVQITATVATSSLIEQMMAEQEFVLVTHPADRCAGEYCCIHNPSWHHMRNWPLVHRLDKPIYTFNGKLILSERTCPHGIGHPDPDSLSYMQRITGRSGWGTHGCDRCCVPPVHGHNEHGLARESESAD